MCMWERNFARLLGYCLRQFVCPAAGHGAKGESALLKAPEGSAGSRPQPGPCSADSCFIWHLCLWWFFPRDVKAALWGGKVHSAAGIGGKSPSLPCLARRAFAPAAGQSQHWGNTGAGCVAPTWLWTYRGAVQLYSHRLAVAHASLCRCANWGPSSRSTTFCCRWNSSGSNLAT